MYLDVTIISGNGDFQGIGHASKQFPAWTHGFVHHRCTTRHIGHVCTEGNIQHKVAHIAASAREMIDNRAIRQGVEADHACRVAEASFTTGGIGSNKASVLTTALTALVDLGS